MYFGNKYYENDNLIDARKTSITIADANTILNRAAGSYGGELPGTVEIWTNEEIVTR